MDIEEDGNDVPSYSPRVIAKIPIMQEMSENPLRDVVSGITSTGNAPQLDDESNLMVNSAPDKTRTFAKTTILKLISTNATSSAFPESFGLSVSITGRWLAACSSSALFLLSVVNLPEYTDTCRAFRIRRKPLAVAVTDNGRFAVLTTSHKIDVYQCGEERGDLLKGACKKLETIYLNNEARTLAFSKCGEVVVAGSELGVEIKNLSAGCLETDKRQINCSNADLLVFSRDGRSLLATSSVKKSRYSTFISINEAFEDAFIEEDVEQQPLGKIWITQLLFPEKLSVRQAALLPSSSNDLINNEILAFDAQTDRYRIFDITMKRFTNRELGLPDEIQWSRSHKLEDAPPAISSDAALIATAIRTATHKEVWVYTPPASWWDPQEMTTPDSERTENDETTLTPLRNIRLPPKEDGDAPEVITRLQWLDANDLTYSRLLALFSTANVAMPEDVVPIEAPAASAKVLMFDTVEGVSPSDPGEDMQTTVLDLSEIPLDEGLADEVLELDREVDIVRRRTQVQRNGPTINALPSPRGSLRRSASSGSTSGAVPTLRDVNRSDSSGARSARRRRSFSSMSSFGEEGDQIGPIDEPYSQTQPRSQFTLHRAATIAANAPANRLHLRALPERPLEYRRADGTREMPHESDADNWVPPPPPYTERPDNTVSHPISSNSPARAIHPSHGPQRQGQIRTVSPMINGPPMRRVLTMVPPPLNSAPVVTPPTSSHRPTHSNSSTISSISSHRGSAHRSGASRIPLGTNNGPTSSPAHLNDRQITEHSRNPSSNSSAPSAFTIPTMPAAIPVDISPLTPPEELVGRSSPATTTPVHNQAHPAHRHSGSGDSRAPTPSQPRHVASAELMRSLAPISPPSNDRSTRGHRPALNRLATIASGASSHHATAPPPVRGTQSVHTTPETPTSRRQWWKLGGSSRDVTPPSRPESRTITQYAPAAVAVPAALSSGGRQQKEKDGGLRCTVM